MRPRLSLLEARRALTEFEKGRVQIDGSGTGNGNGAGAAVPRCCRRCATLAPRATDGSWPRARMNHAFSVGRIVLRRGLEDRRMRLTRARLLDLREWNQDIRNLGRVGPRATQVTLQLKQLSDGNALGRDLQGGRVHRLDD